MNSTRTRKVHQDDNDGDCDDHNIGSGNRGVDIDVIKKRAAIKTVLRSYNDSAPTRRSNRSWSQWVSVVWRIIFAGVAILDLLSCWETLRIGWNTTTLDRGGTSIAVCSAPDNDNETTITTLNSNLSTAMVRQSTCSALNYVQRNSFWISQTIPLHVLFCLMCLIEMVVRALEAHRLAIENDVIAKFEASLSRAYYSATRMYATKSFSWMAVNAVDSAAVEEPPQSVGNDNSTANNAPFTLPKSTLRLWIPVCVTCFFWFSLLPSNMDEYYLWTTPNGGFDASSSSFCGTDSSLATMWITTSLTHFLRNLSEFQERINTQLWEHYLMPYNALAQPRRFWKRVRDLLWIIKLFRFAGPLARMIMKLSDQLSALFKTWRQSMTIQNEREKRIRHPSLLIQDLRRIESIAKVQTALASLPSQFFDYLQDGTNSMTTPATSTPSSVAATTSTISSTSTSSNSQRMRLREQQQHGRYIQRQLHKLHREIRKSMSSLSTADLYDKVTRLSEAAMVAHHKHISGVLSSRQYLISPRTRFSVVWRITVTNCLLLELTRLAVSWYLTDTFGLSITQLISRLVVHCDQPKDTQNHFRFLTDRFDHLHKSLAMVIPLIPIPQEKWILCVPTSFSARVFLFLGFGMETFIDVVSFLDIFIWFFTGDLDERGIVVPKGFISRCVIPGTLVQVLDHPTLPSVLPSLLQQVGHSAAAVGWSRALRWALAIGPALAVTVVQPFTSYFFTHIADSYDRNRNSATSTNDLLMSCAESFGYLPERPSSSSRNVLLDDVGMEYDAPQHQLSDIQDDDDDYYDYDDGGDGLATTTTTSLATTTPRRQRLHPTRLEPSMSRSTPSTLSSDLGEESLGREEEDGLAGMEKEEFSTPLGSGFHSSVRFSHQVTILDRLDSVESSYYNNDDGDGGPFLEDSSSFDIGYSLSSRDLQSLNGQDG